MFAKKCKRCGKPLKRSRDIAKRLGAKRTWICSDPKCFYFEATGKR